MPRRGRRCTAPASRETSNLIVYFDDAHVSPAGRRRVLADLRQALAAGTDGADRLMLAVFDGRVQILHPLTADRQAVVATLEAMPDRATGGIYQMIDRQHAVRAVQAHLRQVGAPQPGLRRRNPECDCGWQEMEAVVREFAGAASAYVDAAADGLSQITSALSGVEGARPSSTWPTASSSARHGPVPLADRALPRYERELSANFLMNDQSSLLGRLTAHANANGVTFYPFEALGLQTAMDLSQVSHKFTASTLVQQIATANRQSPLFMLAADTGGLATLNANSFGPRSRLSGKTSPATTRLASPRATTATGTSTGSTSKCTGAAGCGSATAATTATRSSRHGSRSGCGSTLLLGSGSNPFGAVVEVGEPRLHGQGCCTVPVEIRLPLDRVALGDGAGGRFYVVLAGRSAAGKALPIKGREIVVGADSGEEVRGARTLVVEVDLAPGPYEIAVGLLDYQGGGQAYVRTSADVAPPADSAPAPR